MQFEADLLPPERTVKNISSRVVAPVNPHRQWLLTADAKAKAKRILRISRIKSSRKSKDRGNEPHPTRAEYSEAKKNFIIKNLCLQKNHFQRCSPPIILFLSMAGAKDEESAW